MKEADLRKAILALRDIVFRRDGREILSGISWDIERGQHWALLGANGSGKTTLLKIVTGYEWPTEGAIEVLGRRFGECNLPELRKAIGWVSSALEHRIPAQNRAIEVVASGFDAAIGVYRVYSPGEFERAGQALRAIGGGAFAERPYGALSQGEQQRALLARALVNRPALLILDEPCAGLDPAARQSFLDDLERLARQADAPTLVFVTHHIEEIGPAVSHTLILKSGRVLASGPTGRVLTSARLTEAFGRPCKVERARGRCWLRL